MEGGGFWINNGLLPYQNIPDPYISSLLQDRATLSFQLEALNVKNETLLEENRALKERCQKLEETLSSRKKIRRRDQAQLDRSHRCPYDNCNRVYASDFAVNLHIRNKHNGGSKKERDKIALIMLKCQREGLKPPNMRIKLHPGYLEENRIRLMLLESGEESQQVKTEQ